MSKYVLPDLPYDYGALEPHISGEIMELHHDKHHRKYVETANELIEKVARVRETGDFAQIGALEQQLAFNVSGHLLHSIFWNNMSPDGGGKPSGSFLTDLNRDFGSFDTFKKQMIQTAMTVMGSGWAALVWDPMIRRLGTTQIHDHPSEITQAGIPLLVMDAWEHAYYLQYRTEKAKYFRALWNLWDWEDVQKRYELAQRLDLGVGTVATGLQELRL